MNLGNALRELGVGLGAGAAQPVQPVVVAAGVQDRLQRFVVRRGYLHELGRPVNAAPVHAVQHQAVKVNYQVGGRAKALNQSDRTAVSLVGLEPDLIEQVARDDTVHHLQHRRHQLGLCGQQQAQSDGWREHPLAHRHTRVDRIHRMGCRLRHAPGIARWAKAAPLATECHQLREEGRRVLLHQRYSVVCSGRWRS